MNAEFRRVKEIFLAAVEKQDTAEREAYVREACKADKGLRRQVEALLGRHAQAGSFLESPAAGPVIAVDDSPVTEGPGTAIGPYQLLQQIGEGGMGTVWMAQQTEPVKRLVALKLIKAGMDSKQVIARFEAERQALALMDHPNIARVLDAGTTGAGRPYFVMEPVEGMPITEYCDRARLSVRQRLERFIPVCQAVQHAHHKGIIHRDLKPSNILVAVCDGRPVPKVIDFGVAKLTGPRLSEGGVDTAVGTFLGTPEYMSPEQAELGNRDVDTRSDVYALGVVLYELLTGGVPFSRQQLQAMPLTEMLRIIKEVEPPAPSTKLAAADTLVDVAGVRQSEPKKLLAAVRGELDWIVMKCLEKDRNRRYETADGLAMDVQRYLADEPVQACPPSATYRLRKYARKYKKVLATVGVFAALLVAATVTSIGLASWALSERNHANEQKQLAQANEQEAKERADEIRAVLDFVDNQVFAAARPLGQEGGLGRDVTLRQAIESALAYVDESFRDQPLIEARLRASIGASFLYLGDAKAAETQFDRAHAILAARLGPAHRDTLLVTNRLGHAYYVQGRYREALELQKRTLELQKAHLGPDHPDTLKTMGNVASNLSALGHRDDALKLFEETFELQKAKLGLDDPATLVNMSFLGGLYSKAGRKEDALKFSEEAFGRRKAKYGAGHPATLHAARNLAKTYAALGRHAEALNLHKETLQLRKDKLGFDHPDTLLSMADLARSYHALGRHQDALTLQEGALPLMKVKLGPGNLDTLILMDELAQSYAALGRHQEASKVREEMSQHLQIKHGTGHPKTHPKTGAGK